MLSNRVFLSVSSTVELIDHEGLPELVVRGATEPFDIPAGMQG